MLDDQHVEKAAEALYHRWLRTATYFRSFDEVRNGFIQEARTAIDAYLEASGLPEELEQAREECDFLRGELDRLVDWDDAAGALVRVEAAEAERDQAREVSELALAQLKPQREALQALDAAAREEVSRLEAENYQLCRERDQARVDREWLAEFIEDYCEGVQVMRAENGWYVVT